MLRRSGSGAEHSGPQTPLVRRIHGPQEFGPTFWLGSVPVGYEHFGFAPLDQADAQLQADMRLYACVLLESDRSWDWENAYLPTPFF